MSVTRCLLVLVLLQFAGSGRAQEEDAPRLSESAEVIAGALREEIEEEVASLDNHPWAGMYYSGDGMGVGIFLRLAPRSGFLYTWHGHGVLCDRNHGKVSAKDGKIRLSFTYPNERSGITEELIPVSWGGRRYLIHSGRMVDFCNDINGDSEPRMGLHGMHLLRWGDFQKRVDDFPDVPKEFRPYLLEKPVTATIKAIGPHKMRPGRRDRMLRETQITLDVGRKDRLLPGMELYLVEPDGYGESTILSRVGQHTADCIFTTHAGDEYAPKIGWKFSTIPPWLLQ